MPPNTLRTYTPAIEQLNYKTVNQLIDDDMPLHGVIIYITPNLSTSSLPLGIAKSSNLGLLVVSAGNTWQTADKETILKVKENLQGQPIFTWLVNTNETNLDGTISEIPKQRSWLRKKIKKLVTLNLM